MLASPNNPFPKGKDRKDKKDRDSKKEKLVEDRDPYHPRLMNLALLVGILDFPVNKQYVGSLGL